MRIVLPVVTGFQVREPGASGAARPLSRVFTVRAAADEFLRLARANGHPRAYLAEVGGFEAEGLSAPP